ncbi:MAG: hypothetical protein R3F19_09915 [Verrucomicrobiales bacterium]
MYSDDDIQYAMQMTGVVHEPARRIDTFGTTNFEFILLSELMDSVNQVKVRSGRICAERPMIVKPESYAEMMFEGFGEQAQAFDEWLRRNAIDLSFLKYGFSFRKSDVTESVVHDPLAVVQDRVVKAEIDSGNPSSAVIVGVEDTWEICLLRFTLEMIQKSQGINIFDFKRRGLL